MHARTHLPRPAIGLGLLAAILAAPAAGQTPGRVLVRKGPTVAGDIIAVSPIGVEVEVKGEQKQVPIESIREVTFSTEPQSLKAARLAVMRGQYKQALEDLAKIEPAEMEGVEQLVVDEREFVKAAAIGSLAAASGQNLAAGEKAVRDYLGKYGQSHHAFWMQELLASLLGQGRKYTEAAAALAPLDKGPPAYRVRAAAARARLFYDQQKFDEALREFSAAAEAATDPEDAASNTQKRAAELGKARCMARQGKAAEAVTAVERILAAADPDDKELLAQAYNVLGEAFRAAGKDQDAIIAFLTVALVHNTVDDFRAEALYNLVELWDRGKYPQRADEARGELKSAYPDSIWTRKLAGGKGS